MRSRLLFITALAFVGANAWAVPASRESIETLLTVTRAEAAIDSVYGMVEQGMRQNMQQSVQGQTLSDEQRRVLDAVPGKFIAVMREEFNWQTMKPLYIELYSSTFEQDEIDGLIAFYKSPAGQAFVNKMPIVAQKSITMVQAKMQTFVPKMKAAVDQAMAEAKIPK